MLATVTVAAAVALAPSVAEHAGAEGHAGNVWVNGSPLHGEGSRRLEGCSLDIEVRDLAEGPHSVAISVEGMQPSGTGTVYTAGAPDVVGSFGTGAVDMTPLVEAAGLEKKANGYHLRVSASIDDASAGSAPFWLACGAQQHDGHSWAVQFSVVWRDRAGGESQQAPSTMPAGWALTASSKHSTATCSYSGPGSSLACSYENGGGHHAADDHGEEVDGLAVSGRGTFDVGASEAPAGWILDMATVGTFAPSSVCQPVGGDEPVGRQPCPHTVRFTEEPAPPTTTSSTTPAVVTTAATTPPSTEPTTPGPTSAPVPPDSGVGPGSTPSVVAPGPGPSVIATPDELAFTGSSSRPLLFVALIALTAGLVLVLRTGRGRSWAVDSARAATQAVATTSSNQSQRTEQS